MCLCCMLITVGLCWAEAKLQHAAFHTEGCRDSPEPAGQAVWKWPSIQYTTIMPDSPWKSRQDQGRFVFGYYLHFLNIFSRYDFFFFYSYSLKLTQYNTTYLSINPTFIMMFSFCLEFMVLLKYLQLFTIFSPTVSVNEGKQKHLSVWQNTIQLNLPNWVQVKSILSWTEAEFKTCCSSLR